LDALAGDKVEEAALQTKLLEINLVTNPQVCCYDGLPGLSFFVGNSACKCLENGTLQ
jgi:hypothetical protein